MKALLIHPGHTFSTADVYDGLAAGLADCGVEVVHYRWQPTLALCNMLTSGAAAAGFIPANKTEKMLQFASILAAADSITAAVEHEVDCAIVINGTLFPPQRADILRRVCPTVCYGTEAPYFQEVEAELCKHYDYWFTQERTMVPFFQRTMPNHHAFYLPMAYNPHTHQPAPPDPDKQTDVVFVGGGYPERKAILDGVDWGEHTMRRLGTLWDIDIPALRTGPLDRDARDTAYSKNAIKNSETSAWHRSAKISLNMHRQMTYIEHDMPTTHRSESLGPRAYEIPAVGGFLLSDDDRPELRDVYGDSAATFTAWNSASLEREVRYWLTHDDARERTAAAQYAAVQPHTWQARARQLLETIA